jgi:cyclopropane-fatty-acyl-phospholipid synthase
MTMYGMRDHYRQTTYDWRSRLRQNKDLIVKKWGAAVFEDYDRYLSTCVKSFEKNWQSLHQFSLRRLGN